MTLIQRLLAGLGLVLLIPLAVGLISGTVSLPEAGLRAVTIFVGVLVLRRVVPRLVLMFADTLDGTWRGEPVGTGDAANAESEKR